MIQRIQTLYLLIAVGLMVVTLVCPVALLNVDGEQVTLSAFGISDSVGKLSNMSIFMGVQLALSTLLPLVTIFLFKNRVLQIRLCGAELVMLLGCLAIIGVSIGRMCRTLVDNFEWSMLALRLPVVMPIVAFILVLLAMRATLRDELLVRSLDRIR
ncbi:MAG: DUF4293 domain-containing protein [Alistipes sp.]|nr:DUF4293 domain-containing protein [Alistipes sp.]MBR0394090.1 DUF4293 domain-containing protein [Alistipes sp.]